MSHWACSKSMIAIGDVPFNGRAYGNCEERYSVWKLGWVYRKKYHFYTHFVRIDLLF